MSVDPGSRLGPYEVVSVLGAGGMGEVYRARDTRLDRIVALKILPAALASDPQFRERFDREARVISQLDHPNICTLFDTGEQDGTSFLVMQYLEGETLAARIARGPLKVEEMMAIALQIADALCSAHHAGIVHRDLKPANVMLTKAGAKLLDFGLAKQGAAVAASAHLTIAPTTPNLTGQGTILGTVQYMAPEQLEGREADGRSDIFAFGLVLYEMRAGKPAFAGSTPASVIAAILERPTPSLEPAALDRIVQTCLAKNPDDRFQTARDLKRALEWSCAQDVVPRATPAVRRSRVWPAVAAIAAGTAVVAVGGWYRAHSTGQGNEPRSVTLSIAPPGGRISPVTAITSQPQISPDGSAILYEDPRFGYQIRRLDTLGATQVHTPSGVTGFWSPDSRFVVVDTIGDLRKMRPPDGVQEVIASTGGPMHGGTWSDSGNILYTVVRTGVHGLMYTVPEGGGAPTQVELPGIGDGLYSFPQFIAGTEDFLVLFAPKRGGGTEVYLATLSNRKAVNPVRLMQNDTQASYTPAAGGRLLFVRNNTLYAQRFDLSSRTLKGDPQSVIAGVASVPGFGEAEFSVSRAGTIAWRPGTAALAQLTIFDRSGQIIGTAGPSSMVLSVKLSPDEQRLLVSSTTEQWLVEPDEPGRLTISQRPDALTTLWAQDGRTLLTPASSRVLQRPVGSVAQATAERELANVPGLDRLEDVSFDGRTLLFTHGAMAKTVYSLHLDGDARDRAPVPVLDTGEYVWNTRFSPDARWLVYEVKPGLGTVDGAIYVQPLSASGLRRQISPRGSYPVWRKDGKEIVFYDAGRLWSIRVDAAGPDLHFSAPTPLFAVKDPRGVVDINTIAVSRDGSRFYLPQQVDQPDSDVIHVRLNALDGAN